MTNDEAARFVKRLDKAIQFHLDNAEDQLDIDNAIRCALVEVRGAFMDAMGIAYTEDQPDSPVVDAHRRAH